MSLYPSITEYTVRLTAEELEANLWCLHVVAQGYGDGGPDHDIMVGLKSKLLQEAQAAPRKGADIPCRVVVEGKGW